MPDLVVIQLMPGFMTENLARSLEQPDKHPWAFNSRLSSMNGMRSGVHVVFLSMALPGKRPIGKSGPYPDIAVADRVVLGTLRTPVQEVPTPFFAGYPYEFWFDLVDDKRFEPTVGLDELSAVLNDLLPGLGLTGAKLQNVLSNARSAKIGMFFDGEPRKADYFKSLAPEPKRVEPTPLPAPAAPGVAPTAPTGPLNPLMAAVEDFVGAVKASGLVFEGVNRELPRAFVCGLAAKRFAILTGLSGSGKTQLARAFGQWLGSDHAGPRHLVVPVRADWTTPDFLLGYEDALLLPNASGHRGWSVPPALQLILRAHRDPDRLYALILDEMNLAHVERYFADILSGMESSEPVVPNLQLDERGSWYPVDGQAQLVQLPPNLCVIGTVNVDETTYQFSPKVLDRSFSFEFRVSTDELVSGSSVVRPIASASPGDVAALRSVLVHGDWHLEHINPGLAEIEQVMIEVHRDLSMIGLEFGHRTFREALRFATVLGEAGLTDHDELCEWVLMTKVMPRMHGSRRQLESVVRGLLLRAQGDEVEKPLMPLLSRKLQRMLESLVNNQYAGFAE